jgi:hypothetical protein
MRERQKKKKRQLCCTKSGKAFPQKKLTTRESTGLCFQQRALTEDREGYTNRKKNGDKKEKPTSPKKKTYYKGIHRALLSAMSPHRGQGGQCFP